MKRLIIIFGLPILAGCSAGIGGLLLKKDTKAAELEALQAKHQVELQAKVKETEQAKDKLIESKEQIIVAASNAMYAADMTFKSILTPTRTDLMTNNYVVEGWTVLGRRNPDTETMTKINSRLKLELDEKVTSLAALKANHDAQVIVNQKLQDDSKLWQQKLNEAEKAKAEIIASHSTALSAKQTEIIKLSDQIIAIERERADSSVAIMATKSKMAMIVGGLALACLAGAIWSPVFKDKLGMGAAALGIVAVGILYIQAWHVALVGGVLLLGLIGWAAWDHFKEREAATDVYRAIQSIKTKSKEKYDEIIKPELTEWMTKYGKDGRPRANVRAENHIDKRLQEVGDK